MISINTNIQSRRDAIISRCSTKGEGTLMYRTRHISEIEHVPSSTASPMASPMACGGVFPFVVDDSAYKGSLASPDRILLVGAKVATEPIHVRLAQLGLVLVVGDRILLEVCQQICRAVRPKDLVPDMGRLAHLQVLREDELRLDDEAHRRCEELFQALDEPPIIIH